MDKQYVSKAEKTSLLKHHLIKTLLLTLILGGAIWLTLTVKNNYDTFIFDALSSDTQ